MSAREERRASEVRVAVIDRSGGAGRSGGGGGGHGATAGAATVFSLLRDVTDILRRGDRVATADPEQSGDLGSIFGSPVTPGSGEAASARAAAVACLRTCCTPLPPSHCSTERPDAARVT